MTACHACGFANPPGMNFCGGCGQPLDVPTRRAEAERRQLTVMFCDLVGSAALADRLDPEELRDVIRDYQQAAGEAIRAFEGHVAQHLGDGLLVYFGYPLAHEDDARRAVLAGLGVLAAMAGVNDRLPVGRSLALRIGIHTGPVVAGEIGTGQTREQLALGATPNIAARLQEVAEPGTVVVSGRTRDLLGGAFRYDALGARALKGIGEPVEVFRIAGRATAAHVPRFQTPMIGRAAELASLRQSLASAGEGHGHAALVVAEPGLGKSRLVRAFQDAIDDEAVRWYETQCSSYDQASALRPVAALVRDRLQLSPGGAFDERTIADIAASGLELSEAVPLLAGLAGVASPAGYDPPELSPQKQRERTLEVASRVLLSGAASTPVVVLVEDLHWADPSTVEFLQLFVQRTAGLRALLLLTGRPGALPAIGDPPPKTVTLGASSEDDVARMVDAVTGGRPLPAPVVRQIVEKTDGVPLFVEELTKTIVESGDLVETPDGFALRAGAADLSIPLSLQASLTARLDRLPSGKDVAQLAAVIGREFSFRMLQAVADRSEPELAADLRRLVDAEILYQDDEPPDAIYLFKHALIQDAAYEMLLKRTRRTYHGRIAHALLDRFPEVAATRPELVAQHLTEAGEAAGAAGYWLRAGQRAMGQSANLEAASHLRRGLALVESLPASAERDQLELALRTTLGLVLVFTRGYTSEDVEATYRRARELSSRTGDASKQVWITIGIWSYHLVRGELQEAARLARQFLDAAGQSGDLESLARGELLVAWIDFYSGGFSAAARHLDQALAHMAGLDAGSVDQLGVDGRTAAHAYAALCHWHLGDLEASAAHATRALELARDRRHAYSLVTTLAMAGAELASFRRDVEAVGRQARELAQLCEQHGFSMWSGQAGMWLAWAHALGGGAAGAPPAVDPVAILALIRPTGAKLAISYFSTLTAEALMARGDLAQANAIVDEALHLVNSTGDRMWAAETHRVKAEIVRRLAGDTPDPQRLRDAEACLEQALAIARQQGSRSLELRAAVDLGRLWQRAGRDADARRLVAPVSDAFPAGVSAPDLDAARALLASLGDDTVPYTR